MMRNYRKLQAKRNRELQAMAMTDNKGFSVGQIIIISLVLVVTAIVYVTMLEQKYEPIQPAICHEVTGGVTWGRN